MIGRKKNREKNTDNLDIFFLFGLIESEKKS